MIHKKARGCSNFYMLLSFEDKKDGWDSACMERDLTDFDPNYIFDRDEFFSAVKKIINLNYFNRIKQFMIRLFRNNLFLGNKTKNMQKNTIVNCFACGRHPENRTEVMLNCARSNNILQFLIRILKKAGKLSYGCKINMFLFESYPINSIENISLMFTWKHIYNSKYSNDSLLCVPYAFAFKNLISVITHMSLPLTLTAMDILKILVHELKTKT